MIIFQSRPTAIHESRYTPSIREILDRRYRSVFSCCLGATFAAIRPMETQTIIGQTVAGNE